MCKFLVQCLFSVVPREPSRHFVVSWMLFLTALWRFPDCNQSKDMWNMQIDTFELCTFFSLDQELNSTVAYQLTQNDDINPNDRHVFHNKAVISALWRKRVTTLWLLVHTTPISSSSETRGPWLCWLGRCKVVQVQGLKDEVQPWFRRKCFGKEGWGLGVIQKPTAQRKTNILRQLFSSLAVLVFASLGPPGM